MALESVDIPTAFTASTSTHPSVKPEVGYPLETLPTSNTPTDSEANDANATHAPLTFLVKTKLTSAALAFFTAGVNDGSLGAVVPYILRTYNIATGSVAILFACAFAGWAVAALVAGLSRAKL